VACGTADTIARRGVLSWDRGGAQPHSRQEHPHDRPSHQPGKGHRPVAPAHARASAATAASTISRPAACCATPKTSWSARFVRPQLRPVTKLPSKGHHSVTDRP